MDERAAAWARAIDWLEAMVGEPYGTDDVARWLLRSPYGAWMWPRTSMTSLCLSPYGEHVRAASEPFAALEYVPGERCLRVRYFRALNDKVRSEDWPAANAPLAMERVARWLRQEDRRPARAAAPVVAARVEESASVTQVDDPLVTTRMNAEATTRPEHASPAPRPRPGSAQRVTATRPARPQRPR